MGYLGGFNPPKKLLDIQLTNVELEINTSSNTTILTFTVTGDDADALSDNESIRNDLQVTFVIGDNPEPIDLSNNNVTIRASGGYVRIQFNENITFNGNPLAYAIDQTPGNKVRLLIKYKPTNQQLLDTILIAKVG